MRWRMPARIATIFLRADRAVPYGELMDVMEILRAGGYTKIKLVALEGRSRCRGGAGAGNHPETLSDR